MSVPRGRILEVEYSIRATISGPLSSSVFVDIPIRVVNFTSLDTPPFHVDPDAVAGATSLRTRYAHLEVRNHSTDEQLDGESFRLSRRPSGSQDPSVSLPPAGVPGDHVDSDAEVDMIVRKASSQHPEVTVESVRTVNSQRPTHNGLTSIQALVHNPGRARSKTISSIPQSPSSFAKLAQDKLLRMESNSSFTVDGMTTPTTAGSHHDIATLTPSSSLTASHQSLHHPSTSQPSSDFTPKEPATIQALSTPGRIQSAPVRRDEPPDQDIRPNPGRSQSDTTVRSSPARAGPDKLSDVRKRIEELEAKMRGDRK